MEYILDQSRALLMRTCLDTQTKVSISTTRRKTSCSDWLHSVHGHGILSVLAALSALHLAVSTNGIWFPNLLTRSENGMSEALTLALYMLVCQEIGEIPRFPGNKYFYNCVDDNTYAVSLADMTIWATTSDHSKNEAFNHANGDTFVWRYFFPRIGKYFGIRVC